MISGYPVVLAALLLSAPAAVAQDGLELACAGPFAADATEADVIDAFGAENVSHEMQPGPEGSTYPATLVYGDDPDRWVEIVWSDEAARAEPGRISAGPAWRHASGLSVGSPLAEVEAANGGPFLLYGFAWDYGGYVSDWQGGALGSGDCTLSVRFESTTGTTAGMGDSTFSSDDPDMLANSPIVSQLAIAPLPPAPGGK